VGTDRSFKSNCASANLTSLSIPYQFIGVHPDFHDQLEDLAEAREITIANARLYRDYQFECAQQAYRLETELAEEEYMVSEIARLRGSLNIQPCEECGLSLHFTPLLLG